MAQNVAIAAESEGLGICYIGGVRNNPQQISELLSLPDHVYPVFGMCLGYPAHQPDVKPRLPVEAILKEDSRSTVMTFDPRCRRRASWPG
jgi:nitroreductase